MPLLTKTEIAEALAGLPGWEEQDRTIAKQFTFRTFADAIAFVVRLAFEAEAADHHPDLALHYRRVTVTYWTHSEGGLTRKDVDGARAADRLAGPLA